MWGKQYVWHTVTRMTDELPRALAIAWGMETSPSRGPKRELSHESIVDAAIEIANAEGLAALTMQRVAKSFGFTTMALYRYVSSKDDLQILMLDRANAQAADAVIDATDWRAGLRDWMDAVRATLHAHPWLFELYASGAGVNQLALPNMMLMTDNGLRAMRTLDLPLAAKLDVITRLSVLATESVSQELARRDPSTNLDPMAVEAIREVATAERFPDLHPSIADGSYFDGCTELGDPDNLRTELDSFFDRLETQARTGPPATPAPLTPDAAAAVAEREWREAVALRKRATERVNEASRIEAAKHVEYTAAKEFAKASAKAARSGRG